MSIDIQYGRIILCCDDCGATFMLDKGDQLDKVWYEAQEEGWKAQRSGLDLHHFCGSPCEPEE